MRKTYLLAVAALQALVAGQAAAATTFTQLYKFNAAATGTNPNTGMIRDSAGVLYGTTYFGGSVFSLTPPAAGKTKWTVTNLYHFTGGVDGGLPSTRLVPGPGGVLYGSSNSGGTHNLGVVYELTPPAGGQTAWTEQVLYNAAVSDGFLDGDMVRDKSGALIGASSGGAGQNSSGVIYRLTPPAKGQTGWLYTAIYNFKGDADGAYPHGGLVRDKSGVYYGVTLNGGTAGFGTIFSLTPPGAGQTAWTKKTIYNFTGTDGKRPFCNLLRINNEFFGTTSLGGANDMGTVFRLAPPGPRGRAWHLKVLHSFDGTDGKEPFHGLTAGPLGTLYGVTEIGGAFKNFGTIFSLKRPAQGQTGWTETTLHSFNNQDGNSPTDLLRDPAGNLFGLTKYSGSGNTGTAFELTP